MVQEIYVESVQLFSSTYIGVADFIETIHASSLHDQDLFSHLKASFESVCITRRQIKDLRKKRGITQIELSHALGFSTRYIAKVESGIRPSLAAFQKLANYFEVPLTYLVSDTPESPKPDTGSALLKDPKWIQVAREVEQQKTTDREAVMEIVEGVLKVITDLHVSNHPQPQPPSSHSP